MTPDWIAAIAAIISSIVVIRGWFVAASMQKDQAVFKGEIQKTLAEHDTRFAYLHARRGEAIDQVYKRINEIMKAYASSTTALQRGSALETRNLMDAFELFHGFVDYYNENCLYLDGDLREQIENRLFPRLKALMREFYLSEPAPETTVAPEKGFRYSVPSVPSNQEFGERAAVIIEEELTPIRVSIEKQMRTILGIDPQADNGR